MDFFDKRLIYEESMRMPFVIRYPKEIPRGKRIDDIIINVDFPALFLDYAGVKKPDYMQGYSFRDNLRGNVPSDWRNSMYYRYFAHYNFQNQIAKNKKTKLQFSHYIFSYK